MRNPEDPADTRHLRTLFSDVISEKNFKKFEPMVRSRAFSGRDFRKASREYLKGMGLL